MADTFADMIAHRLPRVIASGADYNDAMSICGKIKSLGDWTREWVAAGEKHEALADEALHEGNTITAGEAYARAAVYYHTGQAVYFSDPVEKARLQERREAAYQKALPYLIPPGEPVEIPFEGIKFLGNLRLPIGKRPAPCVLLNPGADSTKEEFYTLENEFLKRGLATFSYDGPGQGLTWWKMKMRPDFEKPVGAIIDVLEKRSEIDRRRIGIWGRSSGGYYAPRAASFEHRISACISIGGYYTLSDNWDRVSKTVKDTCQFMFGAKSHAEALDHARTYTLAGALKHMKCPFLIIHSGSEDVCDVRDSERMKEEAGGPTTFMVFPDGGYVCDNIPYRVRPLMADWMAKQLSR